MSATHSSSAAGANDAPPRLLQRANIAPLALVNLGVGLHAVIWYMAATAMPTAIGDVGGAEYLSWVGSLYLVTTILGGAVTAILKGHFGARNAMLGAGFVVMVGGLVSAAAPSVGFILAGRCIQGLGEGVLIALSYVITRELFDNRLVPRVFGTLAATWGGAVFFGPLVGGVLTELFSWRVAFLGAALLPLPMQALAWMILREKHERVFVGKPPLLRVSLLAIGVIGIAVADRIGSSFLGAVTILAGIAAVALALKLDRHAATHLITTVFPSLRHRVSLGLWVLILMPMAEAGVFVYRPISPRSAPSSTCRRIWWRNWKRRSARRRRSPPQAEASGSDEGEQVRVQLILVRLRDAVGGAGINLQRRAFHQLV